MESSPIIIPQHNRLIMPYIRSEEELPYEIVFNSEFDSGNCEKVEYKPPNEYVVWTARDCAGFEKEGYPKSWFYFSVKGFPAEASIRLNVQRINMLFYLAKSPEVYRPVYKVGEKGKWARLESEITYSTQQNNLALMFDYVFQGPEEEVFFAFSYPFSYEENQGFIAGLEAKFKEDREIYFAKELLTKSCQGRNVDLITISSQEGKLESREAYFHEDLFPERKSEARAWRFRNNKPVVLLTARVHPGETPGSHSMNGILNFLLNKTEGRAYLLRKYFVFMLVPMINPDGVYNGYYRMDTHNQNLNRFYNNPNFEKQPAVFAIKELVTYLNQDKRLFFYCDLHAHAAKKGCFIYGNALNDFVMQVESKLYAKIVSMNSLHFEFENCNFSKKHMKARDRYEELTKEGCGRVAIYRASNVIHSYTLECGYHYALQTQPLEAPVAKTNITDKKSFRLMEDPMEDLNSDFYRQNPIPRFTIEAFENVGKAIVVSILDIFEKNPYSRIPNTPYKSIENIRKEIANATTKIDRFRKEGTAKKKAKKIGELAYEAFYKGFHERNVFRFDTPQSKESQRRSQAQVPFYRKIVLKNNTVVPNQGKDKEEDPLIKKEFQAMSNSIMVHTKDPQADRNIEQKESHLLVKSAFEDTYDEKWREQMNFDEPEKPSGKKTDFYSQKVEEAGEKLKSEIEEAVALVAKHDFRQKYNKSNKYQEMISGMMTEFMSRLKVNQNAVKLYRPREAKKKNTMLSSNVMNSNEYHNTVFSKPMSQQKYSVTVSKGLAPQMKTVDGFAEPREFRLPDLPTKGDLKMPADALKIVPFRRIQLHKSFKVKPEKPQPH